MAALKLTHFSKKSGRLSLTGSEILALGSHCMVNFQTKFKLEYDDLENIKADRVNSIVFNFIKSNNQSLFLGHPVVKW